MHVKSVEARWRSLTELQIDEIRQKYSRVTLKFDVKKTFSHEIISYGTWWMPPPFIELVRGSGRKTTVIASSSAARAVKSVSRRVSGEMEVSRVEQCAHIEIAVRQGINLLCDFDLIPKITQPIRGRRFATREDIAHAACQQVIRFTQGAANADWFLVVFSASHIVGRVW
ncbi:hypothetical protein TNCV_608151 [Trichonephila clavipes]|nr:hypothetical protein TNCV_608151 [Trichonephila clavipes]